MGFLESCLEFEPIADSPIRKGALVDQLIAKEPSPEEIMRGGDDGAKDEARGVELSLSPIGSSGDSSWEQALNGKGEQG